MLKRLCLTVTLISKVASGQTLTADQLQLTTQTTTPATTTNGQLYVDAEHVLRYTYSPSGISVPVAGGLFNSAIQSSETPVNWWVGNYGFGQLNADPSNAQDTNTLQVQRVATGTGGSFLHGAVNASTKVQGTTGGTFKVVNTVTSGSAIVVTTSGQNAVGLISGAAIYGQGIPNGDTLSTVSLNTPVMGQATLTLNIAIAAGVPVYSASPIGVGSSSATDNEHGVIATCYTWQGPSTGNTCVGGFFSALKEVPGSVIPFAADFVTNDLTGLGTAHSGTGVVSAEFDSNASGPDTGTYAPSGVSSNEIGIRKGIDIVPSSNGPSVDGPAALTDGALVRLPGASSQNEPAALANGFRVMGLFGWGNIVNAFTADGSGGGTSGGQTGLHLFSGSISYQAAASVSSGQTTITLATTANINVGQYVFDFSNNCIPAGAYLTGATGGGTSGTNVTATLSVATSCSIARSAPVTFVNRFMMVCSFQDTTQMLSPILSPPVTQES